MNEPHAVSQLNDTYLLSARRLYPGWRCPSLPRPLVYIFLESLYKSREVDAVVVELLLCLCCHDVVVGWMRAADGVESSRD